MMEVVAFSLLALITIVFALMVVLSKNLFHAVLYFAITSFGIAGLLLGLNAEFLAWAVVLVYIGAVVVMAVFAVMLTGKFDHPELPASNDLKGIATGIVIALAGIVTAVVLIQPQLGLEARTELTLKKLGELLLTDYVLPFELVSILLLAALIGAIVIARGKESSSCTSN